MGIPGYDPFRDSKGFWFDEESAQAVIDFFPTCLNLIEGNGAGGPFHLQPWQQSIVANLFGWRSCTDNKRRYSNAFIYVARKNGKSPLCAGIALYLLFCDNVPGAQIYSAAAARDQAAIVFRHAAGFVNKDEELLKRATIFKSFKSIEYQEINAFYKVVSADANVQHGGMTYAALIDEVHAHPNADLIDVFVTSTVGMSNEKPLIIYITTADYMKESVCNEKYDYSVNVRDGINPDPHWLPAIYEVPVEMLEEDPECWKRPEVWRLANPNLGVSVSEEKLQELCNQAQQILRFENEFKRLHCNVRTQTNVKWLGLEVWNRNSKAFTEEDLQGRRCWGGLDLSSNKDLTALVWLFEPDEDGICPVLPRFWIPEEDMRERENRDKVPYSTWVKQGHMFTTPGYDIKYPFVKAQFLKDLETFNVQRSASDTWNLKYLRKDFDDIDEEHLVPYAQTALNISPPMKAVESMFVRGELAHNDHPVLRWNFTNVSVKVDENENMRPDKKKATGRIDGIVALIMAKGTQMLEEVDPPSVYESRGLLAL